MNVVFAGECGTGKSSIINLILGRNAAKASNDTSACTTEVQLYKASIDGCNVRLWDTPGLDEGSVTARANARSSDALAKSLRRLQSKGDIHLLVYCMHGNRAKAALLKHYETVRNSLPTVPVVAVVTRLERYQNRMEDWWSNNAEELANLGMTFADHACVTAAPDCHGLSPAVRERLIHSQRAVCDLIRRNCPSQLLPVRFPITPLPDFAIRSQKDVRNAGSRAINVQITTHRARAIVYLENIPTPLFT